jgi:hypothetical protein
MELAIVVIMGVYTEICIPNYFRCKKYNMVSLVTKLLKEKLKFNRTL